MATPATQHPLEPQQSKHSSNESLPTPPRSPTLSATKDPVTPAREHDLATLEAAISPVLDASPAQTPGTLGVTDYLGYFPPVTPQTSHDPLLLKSRLQSEDHITELRKRKGNSSAAFYQKQNQHITGLLKHLDDHVREAEEEEDTNRLAVRRLLPLASSSLSHRLAGEAQSRGGCRTGRTGRTELRRTLYEDNPDAYLYMLAYTDQDCDLWLPGVQLVRLDPTHEINRVAFLFFTLTARLALLAASSPSCNSTPHSPPCPSLYSQLHAIPFSTPPRISFSCGVTKRRRMSTTASIRAAAASLRPLVRHVFRSLSLVLLRHRPAALRKLSIIVRARCRRS